MPEINTSGCPAIVVQEKVERMCMVPLAFVSGGQAVPGTASFGMDHADEIFQNVSEKTGFFTLESILGQYMALPYDQYEELLGENYLNMFIFSPYAIFEGIEYSDDYNKMMLPYKYELRYDHLARSKSPAAHIRLFDHNGKEIPKEYYQVLVDSSKHFASLPGSSDPRAYGPFIIEQSQVDCAKARACQGKNIWGEDWGTSSYRERRLWEYAHPELERPPISGDFPADEAEGYWNRSDDGRYSEAEFEDMYVSEEGYWGQTLSGDHVIYNDIYDRGPAIFSGISGQIGDLTSYKYLSGDDYYEDNTPYRIVLLLPEFLCFQDGLTIWVEYNKLIEYRDNEEFIEFFHPGYREIVNPELIMKHNLDYTIKIIDGKLSIAWNEEGFII